MKFLRVTKGGGGGIYEGGNDFWQKIWVIKFDKNLRERYYFLAQIVWFYNEKRGIQLFKKRLLTFD